MVRFVGPVQETIFPSADAMRVPLENWSVTTKLELSEFIQVDPKLLQMISSPMLICPWLVTIRLLLIRKSPDKVIFAVGAMVLLPSTI